MRNRVNLSSAEQGEWDTTGKSKTKNFAVLNAKLKGGGAAPKNKPIKRKGIW